MLVYMNDLLMPARNLRKLFRFQIARNIALQVSLAKHLSTGHGRG
jgi:hypothetical protein